MARTTFSGPVASDNGFEGDITGNVSGVIGTFATLVIGTTTFATGALSGTVGDQVGRIPVKIGATTKYIALYNSLTP